MNTLLEPATEDSNQNEAQDLAQPRQRRPAEALDHAEWRALEETILAGVRMTTASRSELVEAMLADHRQREEGMRPRLVYDVNSHALSLRATNEAYKAALDAADLIHVDGGFLVTLSRFIGHKKVAERSATTDMIHDLAAAAQREGLSFFLLGGSEEVNAGCSEELQRLYPRLRIAGRRNGYFAQAETSQVVDAINASGADIVWVGLGKPLEQVFLHDYGHSLRATWAITCGGCFNFVVGSYRRAPLWMQKLNLEWLHRMMSDPRRLFWRYATSNPHALFLVLANRQI